MNSSTLRIATRKSALALWQAEHVAALLRATHPGLTVELENRPQLMVSPLNRIRRVSPRPIRRPTRNMAANEPMPRGMLTRPVVVAG